MKISKIVRQKNNPNRLSIFVDDKYLVSLSEAKLFDLGLKSNQILSASEANNLKKLSTEDKLYFNTLKLVSARAKTKGEVAVYLKRKGAEDKQISEIINKLSQYDLINDDKYIINYLSQAKINQMSKRQINAKLKQKYLPTSLINKHLENLDSDEIANIKNLIERKNLQNKYKDELKLKQYLVGQGFNYQDIKNALNDD